MERIAFSETFDAIDHAVMTSQRADFIAVSPVADGSADGIVQSEHLVDSDTALETGVVASLATVGRIMERRRIQDSG